MPGRITSSSTRSVACLGARCRREPSDPVPLTKPQPALFLALPQEEALVANYLQCVAVVANTSVQDDKDWSWRGRLWSPSILVSASGSPLCDCSRTFRRTCPGIPGEDSMEAGFLASAGGSGVYQDVLRYGMILHTRAEISTRVCRSTLEGPIVC